MPIFLLGLLLGGTSGSVTYALSGDSGIALLVGAIAAVLTWCRILTLIFVFLDD